MRTEYHTVHVDSHSRQLGVAVVPQEEHAVSGYPDMSDGRNQPYSESREEQNKNT